MKTPVCPHCSSEEITGKTGSYRCDDCWDTFHTPNLKKTDVTCGNPKCDEILSDRECSEFDGYCEPCFHNQHA